MLQVDWDAFFKGHGHHPCLGIDLRRAIEEGLDLLARDRHIWQDDSPGGNYAHAFFWAVKESIQDQLMDAGTWKLVNHSYDERVHKTGMLPVDEVEEHEDHHKCWREKQKAEREAKEIHFLDKHGWPIETVRGRPIRNFLRRLIHTRKIKRGPWQTPVTPDPHNSSCDCDCDTWPGKESRVKQ